MERDRHTKLLRPFGKLEHSGNDPNRGNGDVPGSDLEALGTVEDAEGSIHRWPVQQRLAHPHKDDGGGLLLPVGQHDCPNLSGDLERCEVAPEPHAPGGAEGTSQGTAGLRGYTERAPAACW